MSEGLGLGHMVTIHGTHLSIPSGSVAQMRRPLKGAEGAKTEHRLVLWRSVQPGDARCKNTATLAYFSYLPAKAGAWLLWIHKRSWDAELLSESELGRYGCKAGGSTALMLERRGIFVALVKEKRGKEKQ